VGTVLIALRQATSNTIPTPALPLKGRGKSSDGAAHRPHQAGSAWFCTPISSATRWPRASLNRMSVVVAVAPTWRR
jgi:hypothetical protein